MRIYVASSWRNRYQPEVVQALRTAGFHVYDFRHPAPGDEGFHWSEIDPDWQSWTPEQYRDALQHPIAQVGFAQDKLALQRADVTVLVLPCGRSAHLELGFAAGLGQRTAILMLEPSEPELMSLLCDRICLSMDELFTWLRQLPYDQPHAPGGAALPGGEGRLMKTERAIIDQTNALALRFYAILGYTVPKGYRFDQAIHPHERQMWHMACLAQELLTDTDVENALAEAEDD